VAAVENLVQFNVGLPGQSGKPERVYGQLVSPDYFSVLGMEAQRGRLLNAELDKTGGMPAVVISDRFWRSRMKRRSGCNWADGEAERAERDDCGGDAEEVRWSAESQSIGAIRADHRAATLAPELGNDVLHQRNAKDFQLLMRLAPGVTIETAEAALDGITRRLDKDDPMAPSQASKAKRVVLMGAGTLAQIPRDLRPKVLGFFVALMAIVTAIACLNLATMALARGAGRRKELAIRLGVGASRSRLVRQMVTEGILLSLLGGAAGLALAWV